MDDEFDFDAGEPDLDDLPDELRLHDDLLFIEGYDPDHRRAVPQFVYPSTSSRNS